MEQAGTEGLELIMWLVMRGALGDDIVRIHDTYHVPASNTAAALALFEVTGASRASGPRRDARAPGGRAARIAARAVPRARPGAHPDPTGVRSCPARPHNRGSDYVK